MSTDYWIVCAIFMLGITAATWVAYRAGQTNTQHTRSMEIARLHRKVGTLEALLAEENDRTRFLRRAMHDMQRQLQGRVQA